MSFILDALRKSEHERQRSAVPGLSHVPLAVPRHELPRWALAVIGVLAAAVLLLAGAWWQSRRPPPTTPGAGLPAAAAPESPAAPAKVAAAEPAPAPAPAPPAVATPSPAQPASESPPSTPEPRGASEPRTSILASAATGGLDKPRPTPSGPTLPSAAALQARGISVPPLKLELHAYSDVPAERFVFINGRKYVEGQQLTEGPEVITIEPNGVVLSQQGQRFMLAPE